MAIIAKSLENQSPYLVMHGNEKKSPFILFFPRKISTVRLNAKSDPR